MRTITASLLALAACARGPASTRTAVADDECYALTYDDPVRADTTFFPRALVLGPGTDSGAIDPTPSGGSPRFWTLFGDGAAWRRLPTDSLALRFGNGVSATDLIVAHDGERLGGRAEFRFDAGSEPYPVLEVRGRRTDCSGQR